MTLRVVWLPEAQSELMEARKHYDAIRSDLGMRFARAVVETADAIAPMPLRFAVVHKGRRRAGVRWFHYGLFFLVEDSQVIVVAFFHGKRNPKQWQRRES